MKGLLGRLSFVAAIVNLLWLLAAFSAEEEKAQPMPRACAAADSRARPSGPPSLADTVVGSVTS